MPSVNEVIIAAAGSGKTTRIVEAALQADSQKSAITSFTLKNVAEIKKKFYETNGYIPENVTISPWFTFLLRDFVRPYQNFIYSKRIESLAFVQGKSAPYVPKTDIARYFFSEGKNIYNDKISEFACMCNEKSQGLVIDRLKHLYDHIYVDEIQDLAGYDLELMVLLLDAEIDMTLVGDHRQVTYQTNHSAKNRQYSGVRIIEKFRQWEKQGKFTIQYLTDSYRCNRAICVMADNIYPEFPKTESKNHERTGHDGIFVVHSDKVADYVEQYKPQILRYSRKSKCSGYAAINYGESKGLTFNRVLIFPYGDLRDLLETGDFKKVKGSAAKVYVAITRARYSVAFVYDGVCKLEGVTEYIPGK